MSTQPRLWFTDGDRQRLRQRLAQGEPTLAGMLAQARASASDLGDLLTIAVEQRRERGADYSKQALNGAVACLLGGDPAAGERACDAWLASTEVETRSDLGLAKEAVSGAIVHECCAGVLDSARLARLRQRLADLARGLRQVRSGNPHFVGNNWWAVTHSGMAIAAMAVDGLPDGSGGRHDLAEEAAFARGRVAAFLHHFGDAGLYHEGLGYQAYTCAFVLAAILAARGYDGLDLLARFPGLRCMPAAYHLVTVAMPPLDDTTGQRSDGWGSSLSWNDTGTGNAGGAMAGQLLAIAPAEQRGALRWGFDRLHGVASPKPDFAYGYFGMFFSALHYPQEPAVPPTGILSLAVCDGRQGLMAARNRWQDGDDAVFGFFARATHVGGHSHEDAGLLRLIALGEDWILGGGQARGQAAFQSVATPVGAPPAPAGCGQVIWWQADSQAAMAGIDLRPASRAYHERYAAVRWLADGGCDLALMDQIDEHRGLAWDWNLSISPLHTVILHSDRSGFSLVAPGGQTLSARFLAGLPEELVIERMPSSTRGYSSGGSVSYPGRPYLRARFAAAKRRCILVGLAIRRAHVVAIQRGRGVDLELDGRPWTRPFGAAVPVTFEPGISRGVCQGPE